MRLKIVSDGFKDTKVINEATGERLESVVAIEWKVSAHSISQALITIRNVPVEIISPKDTTKFRKLRPVEDG